MISRYKFSLIALIMLVLVCFGFQNQAMGQQDRGSLCPIFPALDGFTKIEISNPNVGTPADFTAGVIGTVEADGFNLVAGMDWMHAERFFDFNTIYFRGPFDGIGQFGKVPTNIAGSQHVAPWNQVDGRNTYIQLTNTAGPVFNFGIPPVEVPVTVHVQVFGSDCMEIVNWCDDYTGYDTHEYDMRNLVANDGQSIGSFTDGEGFVVMTPVKDCNSTNPNFPETALAYNDFTGEFMIHDPDDYRYGAHTYARQAVCEPPRGCCPLGDDSDACTALRAEDSRFITGCEFGFRELSEFEAELCENEGVSADSSECLARILSAYVCEVRDGIPTDQDPLEADGKMRLPGVCVPNPFHQDRLCQVDDFPFNFCGLGNEFSLFRDEIGDLPNGRCVLTNPGEFTNGTCVIDQFCMKDDFGRPCLTGSEFAKFETVRPDVLYGQFDTLPANITAGADLILLNFTDTYVPYDINNPFVGSVNINKNIRDDQENPLSCGREDVCYARFGIDDPIVISDDFVPPTTPPPTTIAPTTPPPTTVPPTTAPPTGNTSGSSSCAIAGSPVQLGTALANVLIPLVPVAFAFGVRAVRRRKK